MKKYVVELSACVLTTTTPNGYTSELRAYIVSETQLKKMTKNKECILEGIYELGRSISPQEIEIVETDDQLLLNL